MIKGRDGVASILKAQAEKVKPLSAAELAAENVKLGEEALAKEEAHQAQKKAEAIAKAMNESTPKKGDK